MKAPAPSRMLHLVSAFIVLLALGATYVAAPDLWKDTITGFATFGGFATFYGVVFGVIEAWRGRRAAEQAEGAARTAHEAALALFNVKGAAEAQTCIRHALRSRVATTECHPQCHSK